MYTHIIELSDGTRISSGTTAKYAIKSFALQERVNTGTELTLGSTCASQVQIELFAPDNALRLIPGEEIKVYEVADSATLLGTFVLERPERSSVSVITLIAYDRITKLDRDMSLWLRTLTEWPYKLFDFVNLLCAECSVSFVNTDIPNGDYLIQKFWADNITGRNLIEWAGQIAGRFCRATPEGNIEFAWYTPAKVSIGTSLEYYAHATVRGGDLNIQSKDAIVTCVDGHLEITSPYIQVEDDGNGNLTLVLKDDLVQQFYFQNGLSFEDYVVAPIERVHIQLTEDDVGVAYPSTTGDLNTYRITGNYLLTTNSSQDLQPVAQALYEILRNVSYTPCTIDIPADRYIKAGNTVQVTDMTGTTFTTYVMSRNRKGQRDGLECVGSHRRDSTSAIHAQDQVKLLQGRVAKLRISLEEVSTELSRTSANMTTITTEQSSIKQTVESISTRVSKTEQSAANLNSQYTEVQQKADNLDIVVGQLRGDLENKADQGSISAIEERFRFGSDGLSITNSGTGMGIRVNEQQVSFTGGESPTTVVRPHDMETTNIRVKVRLDLGGFSWIPRTNKNLSLRWTGD